MFLFNCKEDIYTKPKRFVYRHEYVLSSSASMKVLIFVLALKPANTVHGDKVLSERLIELGHESVTTSLVNTRIPTRPGPLHDLSKSKTKVVHTLHSEYHHLV